jgi:O-antigen/teichoic acid export membrane protein
VLQLINFSRLYAAVQLEGAELASVGLVAAAFQSLSTLAISAFLPVSVDLYRRFSEAPVKAMAYANRIARLAALPGLVAMVIASVAGPPLLSLTFPNYQVNGAAAALIFSSIALFPFFLSWSTALVATKRSRIYVVLIAASLAAGFGAAHVAGDAGGAMRAAIGQVVALLSLTLGVWFAKFLAAGPEVRRDLAVTLGVLAIVLGTVLAVGGFLAGACCKNGPGYLHQRPQLQGFGGKLDCRPCDVQSTARARSRCAVSSHPAIGSARSEALGAVVGGELWPA